MRSKLFDLYVFSVSICRLCGSNPHSGNIRVKGVKDDANTFKMYHNHFRVGENERNVMQVCVTLEWLRLIVCSVEKPQCHQVRIPFSS